MEKMNIPALNHHVGSTERAFVAHVNDLNDFYLLSASVRESLVSLGQELFDEYSQSYTKPFEINKTLHVGDYCACPSDSEDWYRGLIRQLDANGLAIVFKIDYGDVQFIPIQFLRPLQERFCKLNRLAFHCSLANLIRPNDGWPSEVIEEFRSRLTTTFLYARFINYNEIRDISEVEITEKLSKTPLNKDFEQYQIPRPIMQMNDKLLYKYIPMETLDPTQPNQICLLYYTSPSRFYVYLSEKTDSHTSFQADLQKAVQNLHPMSSSRKYQVVAAQDNHAVWYRAIVLDNNSDPSNIAVFFLDIGVREHIPVNNIRSLPEEFQYKPAFAIPCRLNNVCPSDVNEQSVWKATDPVHDEFNRLMVNKVTCQVHEKQDQLCYYVDIDIPKLGDLSTFLFDKSLVSRSTMRQLQRPIMNSGQPSNPSYIRTQFQSSVVSPLRQPSQPRFSQPNDYSNNMPQQQSNRMPNTGSQTSTRQTSSATANSSLSTVPIIPPENGYYKIIQVRNAAEFYGLSQNREKEFADLSNHLANHYNNPTTDSSFSVSLFLPGSLYVIQHDDRYHRVVLKQRDSETRVTVKLIDRGDEILVDTSELLQIDPQISLVPVFAEPFRLQGFEESQNSAHITLNLKKAIFNQSVYITQRGPMINGFYPVEVTFNNQSLNQTLLSNDKNPPIIPPPSANRPTVNQPPTPHYDTIIFNNSTRHHSSAGQGSSGRSDLGQRTNENLPAPQKILTGVTRTQPGRFAGGPNPTPPSNEAPTRFSNFNNRSQQSQAVDPPVQISTWNPEQNNKPNVGASGFSNQSASARQQSGPPQYGGNQRTDDNRTSATNNSNRFSSNTSDNQQGSFEQKRSSGGGYGHDDRNDRQMSGNNERGGFSNRGGDRGGRGGYHDRNMGRNNEDNNENNSQFSGGYPKRSGDFSDRGGRDGGFGDRNGSNRNTGDDQSRSFHSNRGEFQRGRGGRGGYQNRQDQGENGGYERRGGPRDGGFRGGRDGYRNRGNDDIQLSSDTSNNNPTKSFSGWPSARSPANFEAGDRLIDSPIPGQAFKFVVSHIETANQFFIQLLSKGGELSALTELLQNEYKQSPEVNLISLQINQPCLAKFSDNCWYRATVLSTDLTKLQVRFVDFGNTIEVDSKTIRQISKKQCTSPPYAYQCTFTNAQVVENVSNEIVINKCAGKEFHGKIFSKTSDGKFVLDSDELLKLLLEINAIKLQPEVNNKRIKCQIGHLESEKHEFYIQEDENTVNEIAELIESEEANAPILSLDEVKDLKADAIVLAKYDNALFRGIIQSEESDEDVNICFVDYGNISPCAKNSLKRPSEKLSSYPYQAEHCRLYGVPSQEIDKAFTYLGDNSDPDNNVEITIINEKDQIRDVIVYINNQCLNEKFGYDPNKNQAETTVKEQEPLSTGSEQQTDEDVLPTTMNEQEQLSTGSEQQINEDVLPTTMKEQEQLSTESEQQINEDVLPTTMKEQEQLSTGSQQQINEDVLPTTMKEQEQLSTESEQQINEDVLPATEIPPETSAVQESEAEEPPSKYREGFLTHIETTEPYVYLQLDPEIIAQIEELIQKIIEEDKHNPSYEVGDHIIAKYTEEGGYYRARIDSYSSASQLYTVYFLDYGNTDENVGINDLYSYVDDLKGIEPQAHRYLLEKVNFETWDSIVRSLVNNHVGDTVEFYYTDENHSIIHMKFDNENDIYNIEKVPEPIKPDPTLQATISITDNDCFYIHILRDGDFQAHEMDNILQICHKTRKDSWSINDLCIVSLKDDKYYRGRILTINDDKYDVKCIDHGNILSNITNDQLYDVPNEDIFTQPSLAQLCRLYGVDDQNQSKAIEEVIKDIPSSERLTITVENDRNNPCWLIKLVRGNNEVINERYSTGKNDVMEEENKQESDNDEQQPNLVDPTIPDDQSISQSEKIDPINDTDNTSVLSITNNQTIDFGENDPSTTIKDETNNSLTSN